MGLCRQVAATTPKPSQILQRLAGLTRMRLLTAPIHQAVPFKTEAGALYLRTPTEATTILASWEFCHPVVPHRPHTSSRISAPSFALLEDILLQTAHFLQAAPPLQLCRRISASRELCRQVAAEQPKPLPVLLRFANLESMQFLEVPMKQAAPILALPVPFLQAAVVPRLEAKAPRFSTAARSHSVIRAYQQQCLEHFSTRIRKGTWQECINQASASLLSLVVHLHPTHLHSTFRSAVHCPNSLLMLQYANMAKFGHRTAPIN